MTVSTVDVLRAARDLYAQAPSHAPHESAPAEGTYCVITATAAAAARLRWSAEPANQRLRLFAGADGLVDWNAEHSTEEVLAAFDRAIEAEQAKVAT
jgi:hypothetical protein